MKKNDLYKGFRVLETVDCVKDCDAPGIWLRHERTGMEVFHVLKNDDENLFAFVFRTPAENSTGVAHIMEHSVLCGSEKYPLRDPFTRLSNQSLATYLNAFTSPDYTAYPSSSLVRADYFNTFSVYADAVFFPLLREEVFLQEGHRIEFDEKSRASIQGVVYNEMKGKYSSYESVISENIDKVVFAGTRYENDSGGDPMEIPSLSYKEFKAFHKKHYGPANCLLFLYGNIPTEDQLDFIDTNVLSRIKNPGRRIKYPSCRVDAELPKKVKIYGPANENGTKNSVFCAWKLDFPEIPLKELRMELTFLNNLLWNSDSAPVTKALMESGLGDDIAPQTGMTLTLQCHNAVCGLRGVDPKNAAKIRSVIFDSLEKLCREGLGPNMLERVCMAFDFYNREISRNGGPQGLVMLRRCLRGWIYGEKPWESLELFSDFKKLRDRLHREPGYLSEMVHRYFLDNKLCTLITAGPSQKWLDTRASIEKKNIATELGLVTKETALKKLDRMVSFQKKVEGPEEEKLIPRITLDQLDSKAWDCPTRISEINGIQVFANTEPTNGIIYFDLCFAIDGLTPAEYRYAGVVAGSCTDVGWKNVSWSEGSDMQLRLTGNLFGHTESHAMPVVNKRNPDADYVGRDWMIVSFAVLEDKIADTLDMVSDMLTTVDYSDSERMMDLVRSAVNSDISSFASYAGQYALYRSKRKASRSDTLRELWSGLTASYTFMELSHLEPKKVCSIMRSILKKILKGGSILHITSNADGIRKTKKLLPGFIEKMQLVPLGKRPEVNEKRLLALTELPGETVNPPSRKKSNTDFVDELVLINGTVGTVYSSFASSEYGEKNVSAEYVLCHSLSNSELWDLIRMKGGAYGVRIHPNPLSALTAYGTYRDPKPFESAHVIRQALADSVDRVYSDEETEKSIIGRYAVLLDPVVPSEKGEIAFSAILQGRNIGDMKKSVRRLFSVKSRDMHSAAKRFRENACLPDDRFATVIFCPKSLFLPKNKENTGKIISLPL
ncbi:MAG: insulinase family protein [Treponema sp.]|nr:insulinase family protein [Treponema sp.]